MIKRTMTIALSFIVLFTGSVFNIKNRPVSMSEDEKTGAGKYQETIQRTMNYLPDTSKIEAAGKRTFRTRFYYSQLSDTEIKNYKSIRNGIFKHDKKIYIENLDLDRVFDIFELVTNDYPEVFWCDGEVSMYTADLDEDYKGPGDYMDYSVIEIDYNYTPEERKEIEKQIEDVAGGIISGISAEASDYEKINYVFNYIVNNTSFNEQASDNQNIISVFLNRASVCAGYSKAIQLLLEKLDVRCTYVTGICRGEGHAWNLTWFNDTHKYMDATYDVPVDYGYFLCDYDYLTGTHTFDEPQWMPK